MKTLNELVISPSPWQIAKGKEFTEWGYIRDANEKIVGNAWSRINYPDRVRQCADGRLMSAAPELYQSVCDLLAALKNRLPSQPTVDEIEIINRAEAALAKASGESEKEAK